MLRSCLRGSAPLQASILSQTSTLSETLEERNMANRRQFQNRCALPTEELGGAQFYSTTKVGVLLTRPEPLPLHHPPRRRHPPAAAPTLASAHPRMGCHSAKRATLPPRLGPAQHRPSALSSCALPCPHPTLQPRRASPGGRSQSVLRRVGARACARNFFSGFAWFINATVRNTPNAPQCESLRVVHPRSSCPLSPCEAAEASEARGALSPRASVPGGENLPRGEPQTLQRG